MLLVEFVESTMNIGGGQREPTMNPTLNPTKQSPDSTVSTPQTDVDPESDLFAVQTLSLGQCHDDRDELLFQMRMNYGIMAALLIVIIAFVCKDLFSRCCGERRDNPVHVAPRIRSPPGPRRAQNYQERQRGASKMARAVRQRGAPRMSRVVLNSRGSMLRSQSMLKSPSRESNESFEL